MSAWSICNPCAGFGQPCMTQMHSERLLRKMHSKQQTPSSSNTTVVPPNCAHDAAHQTPVKGKNDGTYEVFVLAFFPDGALRGPLCMWGVLKRDENGDRSVRGELIDADVARLSLPLPV